MPNPNASTFMVYPRGFVGAELSMAQKATRGIQINLSNISSVIGGEGDVYPHNEEVNQLADIILRTLPIIETLDFRKRVILAALSAFGTKSFYYWYQAQYTNPMFSDYHSRFLDDTIRFIETGHRDMPCTEWLRCITFDDSHPTYEITEGRKSLGMSKVAHEYFQPRSGGGINESHYSLQRVIQNWISHEGGVEDLVVSMYIMFGFS